MLYPFTFQPIFKERVWGGRSLEQLFQKTLPPGQKIGESWEISDRPGDVSVIANGPLKGQTLRWLMENHSAELLGPSATAGAPFPLLVKILDAEEKLSLQVHPPAAVANELGGEPKTEMWYIVDAKPQASVYAGLRKGVTRDQFESKIQSGQVQECIHRIGVKKGDTLFLPSGRVHAIGAGNVLFEVQQNSDTTYRVFDWNRAGLDGKPRELQVAQSLRSINFQDVEPSLVEPEEVGSGAIRFKYLVNDELFRTNITQIRRKERIYLRSHGAQILGIVTGKLTLTAAGETLTLTPGTFVLIPASVERLGLTAESRVEFLQVQF